MAALEYRVISGATAQRAVRKVTSDATIVSVRVSALRAIESSTRTETVGSDDAEWERAFASPEFAQIVARARAQIAGGHTTPLRQKNR